MKPTEFIVENSIIAQEADDMHKDHEVQMARSQMYSAAQAAIEIHRLLRDVSEMEGLEGWVQSKLTLASQYLESVRDYMKYEAVSQEPEMMAFAEAAADYAIENLLAEDGSDQMSVSMQKLPTGKVYTGTYDAGPGGKATTALGPMLGGAGQGVQRPQISTITNTKGQTTSFAGRPPTQTDIDKALNEIGETGEERDLAARFEKKGSVKESATGGSSSASGMAISMGGPGHKPTSGIPKKISNSYKPKKVAVGKGVY